MSNPQCIIIAGDQKQLSPFARSKIGKEILERSPLEVLMERAPKNFVLLDVSYRMPWNLYWPTSKTFYEGKVRTHPGIKGRSAGLALSEKMSRIWFSPRGDGKWFQLGHSMLALDVRGQRELVRTSSRNDEELRVLHTLTTAMVRVGVSEKDISLLTPF